MEFCLPPTELGAVMPRTEVALMIDWAHTNPLNSADANRPRQADDGAEEFEESILRQIPPDTDDPLSRDIMSKPSRLSRDPHGTAATPDHGLDVEKAVTPPPNSGNPHDPHDETDGATTTTPGAPDCSDSTSKFWLPAAAARKEGPANKRRRSTTGPSTEEARAKNRLAASKCRRKKKVEERGLEERQRRLNLQRAILRKAADALVHEVLALKHEVLRHAACGFTPLDHYIAEAAARGSVSSAPSTSP